MENITAESTAPSSGRLLTSVRRLAVLFLLSIPAAAATVWDEIVLAGPIVFLTEAFGFVSGLMIFIVIWAALGIGAMAAIDFVWPYVSRSLGPVIERFTTQSSASGDRPEGNLRLPIAIVLGLSALAAIVLVALFAVDEIGGWVSDHWSDLLAFSAAIVVVFVLLVIVDRLTRGLEKWVRSIAETAGPGLRSAAALVTMVALGPVLGWPVLRLLHYSRGATYALTLVAAPVFGFIWVPFYSLGVWGIVTGLV